jgi:hypothetical protein
MGLISRDSLISILMLRWFRGLALLLLRLEVCLVLISDIFRDLRFYRDQTLRDENFEMRFSRRDSRREWSFSGGKGVFLARNYIHK